MPVRTVICQIDEGAGAARARAAARGAAAAPASASARARGDASAHRRIAERRDPRSPVALQRRRASGAMGPLASPTARRAALEQGVDLQNVRGSGEHGRITRDDVMRAGVDVPPRTEPPMSMAQRAQADSQVRAPVDRGAVGGRPSPPAGAPR